ncbi:MAG: S4 domain-containing protein, partial [Flammeovirgaceae bacterium]
KRSFGGEESNFGRNNDKETNEDNFGFEGRESNENKSAFRKDKKRFGFGNKQKPDFNPIVETKKKHVTVKKAVGDVHTIRLNRFIANAGVCSRREADELIATGQVTVNGKTITEMGFQVHTHDDIRYQG